MCLLIASGGPLTKGLRRVIRDVKLGSLLIQSDPTTGEPLLFHTSFPATIQSSEQAKDVVVFLMDSQVSCLFKQERSFEAYQGSFRSEREPQLLWQSESFWITACRVRQPPIDDDTI